MKKNLKTKFKVWDSRYDFTEINQFNYRQIFKNYFKLTTKKITLMALLVGITVIFGVISQFVLGVLKIQFLSFNITVWTTIIAFMAFNFFYSFLILEFTVWLRFLYGGMGDLAGTVAMNLNDLTFLIFIVLLMQLGNYLRFQFQKEYQKRQKMLGYFWTLLIVLVLANFLTTGMDLVYNYGFLIDWYNFLFGLNLDPSAAWILILLFWFNLAQGFINIAIFLMLYKVSFILINNYFI